ncbi:MAG: hypothetical protein CM15mP23_23090 [Cryomorphaceae bacterium]|nr:MAG: hypothetical protein CM15mP23_23090 [Cryomorphaceae bacterium]
MYVGTGERFGNWGSQVQTGIAGGLKKGNLGKFKSTDGGNTWTHPFPLLQILLLLLKNFY